MTISISIFEDAIKEHMEAQPYEINCSVCCESLDIDKGLDDDMDLIIDVTPCKCQKSGN